MKGFRSFQCRPADAFSSLLRCVESKYTPTRGEQSLMTVQFKSNKTRLAAQVSPDEAGTMITVLAEGKLPQFEIRNREPARRNEIIRLLDAVEADLFVGEEHTEIHTIVGRVNGVDRTNP